MICIITVPTTMTFSSLSRTLYNPPLADFLGISWYKSLTLTCKKINKNLFKDPLLYSDYNHLHLYDQ